MSLNIRPTSVRIAGFNTQGSAVKRLTKDFRPRRDYTLVAFRRWDDRGDSDDAGNSRGLGAAPIPRSFHPQGANAVAVGGSGETPDSAVAKLTEDKDELDPWRFGRSPSCDMHHAGYPTGLPVMLVIVPL